MKRLEMFLAVMADHGVAFIIWIRCFFQGHSWRAVSIVATEAMIQLFNVQRVYEADGEPCADLALLKIRSPLCWCEHCGKVVFGPWGEKR